jgi:hypothetical protein
VHFSSVYIVPDLNHHRYSPSILSSFFFSIVYISRRCETLETHRWRTKLNRLFYFLIIFYATYLKNETKTKRKHLCDEWSCVSISPPVILCMRVCWWIRDLSLWFTSERDKCTCRGCLNNNLKKNVDLQHLYTCLVFSFIFRSPLSVALNLVCRCIVFWLTLRANFYTLC